MCTCTGTVRYGKNGIYLYYASNPITLCGNEVAGDPLVGTFKQCDCKTDPFFNPPNTTYQTQNLTFSVQSYGPMKNSNNNARLATGNNITLKTYSGPDVYNIDSGRCGLFQNGDMNLALRHQNSIMYTHPFQPNNYDFAWRIWAYGSKYRLYNDYGGGVFVGYDAPTDALMIVSSTDPRIVNWDITPAPLSGYVWTPPGIQTNIQVQIAGANVNTNSVSLTVNGYGTLSVNVSYTNQSVKATGCPPGSYCPGGVLTPIPCPSGSYNPLYGQPNVTSCLPCPRGAWCGLGSAITTLCGNGTYSTTLSANASSTCSKCIAGKYSSALGANSSTTCSNCNAGTYATGLGMDDPSDCVNCVPGTYSTASGASVSTTCAQCIKGTYSTVAGANANTTCTQCQGGTYNANLGASSSTSCINCVAGTYSTTQGGDSGVVCQYCVPGYYAFSGSTACQSCVAGTYGLGSGASSATACALCVPGTYSTALAAAASSTCAKCDAGTFSTVAGSGSQGLCVTCGPGTYSTSQGNSGTCTVCASGSYCPNSVSQISCPVNTVSQPGQTSQLGCTCIAGYFCTYDKVAKMSISLNNIPLTDWQNNVNGIQDAFIAAVAQAAGVPPSSITIVSVTMPAGRRRLLEAPSLLINIAIEGGHTEDVKTEWNAPDLLREMRRGAESLMAIG